MNILKIYSDLGSIKLDSNKRTSRNVAVHAEIDGIDYALGAELSVDLSDEDVRLLNTLFRAAVTSVMKENGVIDHIDQEIAKNSK